MSPTGCLKFTLRPFPLYTCPKFAVLRPTYAKAYNNLCTALAFQGKREEAVEQFKQALTLQPGYDEARRNLMIVRQGVVSPALAISGGDTTERRP